MSDKCLLSNAQQTSKVYVNNLVYKHASRKFLPFCRWWHNVEYGAWIRQIHSDDHVLLAGVFVCAYHAGFPNFLLSAVVMQWKIFIGKLYSIFTFRNLEIVYRVNVFHKNKPFRVVRKQRRTAISPATQVTCTVYFFVRSKKYLSIQSKHANWQLYGKMITKSRHIFTKVYGGGPPYHPSWSSN